MPDALPLTGLYGKVPAHGDFVRRGLPTSFVGPWDAWLQDGMATARERLGERWAAAWDAAPPWRFALPAGACGPDAVAGVMLTSEDMVGRRFPITLAALLLPGTEMPAPAWFAALEMAALAARAGRIDADGLAGSIPAPDAVLPEGPAVWAVPEAAPDAAGLLGLFAEAPPPAAVDDASDRIAAAVSVDDDGAGLPGGALPPGGMMPAAGDDVLALLGLGTADEPPSVQGSGPQSLFATAAPEDDVLGLLVGSATPVAPDEPIPTADTVTIGDGTLAFLLGEAAAEGGEAAALLPGGASEPQDGSPADPLTALIASGGSALGGASDDAPSPPALVSSITPAPAPQATPAEVPAAPSGGGWWTGGSGLLPPTIRPFAALLPPGDFASLLEVDA